MLPPVRFHTLEWVMAEVGQVCTMKTSLHTYYHSGGQVFVSFHPRHRGVQQVRHRGLSVAC